MEKNRQVKYSAANSFESVDYIKRPEDSSRRAVAAAETAKAAAAAAVKQWRIRDLPGGTISYHIICGVYSAPITEILTMGALQRS